MDADGIEYVNHQDHRVKYRRNLQNCSDLRNLHNGSQRFNVLKHRAQDDD